MFSIGEALREAAISRATFFRWVKDGVINDAEFRDRNRRRVFTAEEVDELRRFSQRLVRRPPTFSSGSIESPTVTVLRFATSCLA